MKKRRLERIAVMILSIAMLLSSTGIMSSLAANVSESSSMPTSAVSEPVTSTTIAQEGGVVSNNEVAQEGGAIVANPKGDGTVENPYQISSAEDFLNMNSKINSTTSSNKNFVLTADIDLSSVTEETLIKNGGSLVTVNKTLEKNSDNIFFNLDGQGHKIKGFNINVKSAVLVSIFGCINAKSSVKNLIVEKPQIHSTSAGLVSASTLVYENKGTISNVEISYPVISLAKSDSAAFAASKNEGIISKVTVRAAHTSVSAASAENHTISATGTVGAIAAINTGKIVSTSAVNIGMYIPADEGSKTVYGTIAGRSSGIISDSVATGNVYGGKTSDVAGGIVGRADTGLKLINNYTLVALGCAASGCAVIGIAGTPEMLSDCYWSSAVSKRTEPVTDCDGRDKDLSTGSFKVLPSGKTLRVTAADTTATSWGKAVFELDGAFSSNNENITALNEASTVMAVRSGKADSVNVINYVAKISLPAPVGSGVAIKQYMRIYILNVPENTAGNGTKESPLEISNATQLSFFGYVPNINCKLTSDFVANGTMNSLSGSLDGCGYTIRAKAPLFRTVSGTVSNLNVIVESDVSGAIFGNVIGASMTNVGVSMKNDVKLIADRANTGILADKITGKASFNDCRVKGSVSVASENISCVGGFAGCVAGEGTEFINSGAVVDITVGSEKKASAVAGFAGVVSAENVKLESCYVGGANLAGDYMFIGKVDAKSITVRNITLGYTDEKNAASVPVNFTSYGSMISTDQFGKWTFDSGNTGFFTGNGGRFETTLPSVKSMLESSSADFSLNYDATKIVAYFAVSDGKGVLSINRAGGVVTVKAIPVTITNNKTGLSTVIYVSNGLEKDGNGNYIITSAFDLAYIGENISEMSAESFILNRDIDMSDVDSFVPIGSTAVAFSGTFDGCGHTIANLSINGTAKTALFGTLADATVKNIRFVNASVNSESGYAAVVAGQTTGKTVISGIRVEKSTVNSTGNYAAVITGSVDNATAVTIKDISVKASSVISNGNYVGAVAGKITDNTKVENISVDGFKATGSNYVAGAIGLAQGESSVEIVKAEINSADVSGVSEISGVASCVGKATIKNADVKASEIYTLSTGSAFTAGGISAVGGALIENVNVENTKITAGMAGGIVGKTAVDCELVIANAKVISSEIASDGANTVAAGILGVHGSNGTATVINSVVSADTIVSGAAVTAGIVGDCAGADSIIEIKETKTFAAVKGCESANAISAAGAIGRIGASAINSVHMSGVVVGGSVSGLGMLGGFIGCIKRGEAYNGSAPVAEGSIAFAEIGSSNPQTQTGMVIGGLEAQSVLTSDMLDKAFNNIIISTYYGAVSAYSAESKLEGGNIRDMDKPNGKPISASTSTLSNYDEVEVNISNLPSIDGFIFDSETGWISESDERIQVVSCTENTAVLKAKHMANISIVAYYVLDSDSQIRVPVHFAMAADVRTALHGKGTLTEPYLVTNAYELETVAQYSRDNAYFALAEDIVLNPEDFEFGGAFYNVGNGFVTIGDATCGFKGTFTGLYNGKIHSITGLSTRGNTFGGLFGATDGAVISDLIINNADISGLNYAGAIVGSARNTVIKNVTINSAAVSADDFGGYAGTIVGYAESTTIENVKINNTSVSTNPDASIATVEIAGGVAGVFDGKISGVKLTAVTVNSGSVAAGVVGDVRGNAEISDADVNVTVISDIAGGVAGRIESPLKFTLSDCCVSGNVNGKKAAAGVIGQIISDSSAESADKAKLPLVSETVISAVVDSEKLCGVVIGDASENVIRDIKSNVFDNVYYSSYMNKSGLFGNEKLNAYQNAEYSVTDLSNIKYVVGDTERDNIPFTSDVIVLGNDSIKLDGVQGNYKLFTAAGKTFKLETITSDIDGAISYNALTSAMKLNASVEGDLKAVFVYNNGLEIAINVSRAEALKGEGTAEAPYELSSADDFSLMMQNASAKDVFYVLKNDISLKGIASADVFAGNLDGNGYVLYDYTGSSLFGLVTGTISNTGFAGFKISDRNSVSVGAVAGVVDGGMILNSFVIADVKANGTAQDAGIVAGRAVNGAVIENVLTSGRVVGDKALTVGGVVGMLALSEVGNVTSTAYVKGGKTVGGIVGESAQSKLDNVIFGNMAETNDGKCGNIIGATDDSIIGAAYYDSSTAKTAAAAGAGICNAKALTTAQISELKLDGFASVGGYPVAQTLVGDASAKFATAVAFASMKVNYLNGSEPGTACNYTAVTAADNINGNEVKLDTSNGLKLTLVANADYSGAKNEISRYANPLSLTATSITCNVVDKTNGALKDKLVGVSIKSKAGDSSYSFDMFVESGAGVKSTGTAIAADEGLYVSATLPQGIKYSISAVDENGRQLEVSKTDNNDYYVAGGSESSVVITVNAEKESNDIWGLHAVWGVIGK